MKSLLIKSIAMLMISLAFSSCQKEIKKESGADDSVQTTMQSQGNGIIETVQRAANGGTVIFSNWITKNSQDWTGFYTAEISTDFNTTSLTNAVADKGLVLMYHKYDNTIRQLPYVNITDELVLDYKFIPGKMMASFKYSGAGTLSPGLADQLFRYILIPSNTFGNIGSGKMSQQVDYKNYNAVCEYYEIAK